MLLMDLMIQLVVTILISASLATIIYYLKMLTFTGVVASFIIGSIIGIFGSIEWLIVLIIFTLIGLFATKVGIKKKKEEGLQEGKHGERNYQNVVGVGLAPCILAFIFFIQNGEYDLVLNIMFICTLCVAAADTVASELGVKDKRVWMITTLKKTVPGTNGGVSVYGTVTSIFASFFTALIGWILIFQELSLLILIPTIAGMIGNIADSFLGATLENRGHISKYVNNFLSSVIGGLFGLIIYIL